MRSPEGWARRSTWPLEVSFCRAAFCSKLWVADGSTDPCPESGEAGGALALTSSAQRVRDAR